MTKQKKIRERGKLQLSKYFQNFNEGESVAVIREHGARCNFPSRLQGRTGKVETKRGKSYMVKIKDQNMEKQYLIEPIHLKKINEIQKVQ
jgi:ribosomal protein L21E